MVTGNDMVNHFAVVSNDSLEEYGVKNGQIIYLAGNVLVPITEDHPFDFRMKFLGAFVVGGHITVNDNSKMFYIDPESFQVMDSENEAELIKRRDEDFKQEDKTG